MRLFIFEAAMTFDASGVKGFRVRMQSPPNSLLNFGAAYGFPVDLTQLMARARPTVDVAGFEN
jgi:hypothetical protein